MYGLDGCLVGCIDRSIDVWLDGWMNKCIDGWNLYQPHSEEICQPGGVLS